MFLTPEEIQRLTGYEPNQRVRIGRWLKKNGYPYTTNRLGDPVVRRSDVENSTNPSTEPNLEWLRTA